MKVPNTLLKMVSLYPRPPLPDLLLRKNWCDPLIYKLLCKPPDTPKAVDVERLPRHFCEAEVSFNNVFFPCLDLSFETRPAFCR